MRSRCLVLSFVCATVLGAGRADAAVITVTGTGDTNTNTKDGVVTLREAILAANTNAAFGDAPAGSPGLDTIQFAIPASGVQTITLSLGGIGITDALTIDGYTQSGATPNTATAGTNAKILIEIDATGGGGGYGALDITASGCTLRGLAIGNSPVGAIALEGVSNTIIAGNFLGTDASGTVARLNNSAVRMLDSSSNTIGGAALADRNLISGNSYGVMLQDNTTPKSNDNVLRNNLVGTDATGTAALPNQSYALYVSTLSPGTIVRDNLVSGNKNSAVVLFASATVQANVIGLDATGAALGNMGSGVALAVAGSLVGGTNPGDANVIANNGQGLGYPGVSLSNVAQASQVLGNSIFANGNRGIYHATPPARPSVSTAYTDGATTTVQGSLAGAVASTSFRIEVFVSAVCNSKGPDGKTYLGFVNATTDANGNATFSTTVNAAAGVITVTATGAATTSEFSSCVSISAPPPDLSTPPDLATAIDLALPLDLALPFDLAPLPDLAPPGDLASADLASPVDLATNLPDGDFPTADFAAPVDLGAGGGDLSTTVNVSGSGGCSCEVGARGPAPGGLMLVALAALATALGLRRRREG